MKLPNELLGKKFILWATAKKEIELIKLESKMHKKGYTTQEQFVNSLNRGNVVFIPFNEDYLEDVREILKSLEVEYGFKRKPRRDNIK